MAKRKQVQIFTDGACSGNPGPGGWGAILHYEDNEKAISGSEPMTTNNRMELMAAIMALRELKEPCDVVLSTDSEYVQKGITTWIDNWVRKGWKGANNQPIKNQDLWRELKEEEKRHNIRWEWVRGHAGHIENEKADELARAAILSMQGSKG